MRQRCINSKNWGATRTEEQAGKQPIALHAAGLVAAAVINPAKRNKKSIGGDVAVRAENTASALPEISDHDDVGLVIARASFDPRLPLAHVIGSSRVCVPISSPDFQTAELM